jgi:uncharacterized protein
MPDAPSPIPYQPVAPAWHTGLYLFYRVVVSWQFYRFSLHWQPNPAHSQIRFFSILIVANTVMLVYLGWGLHKRNTTILALIGGRWSGFWDVLKDFGIALLFWFASLFVIAGLRFLLHLPPAKSALAMLTPHTGPELCLWFLVACSAGFTEELLYRGYLQKQFEAWTKNVGLSMGLSAILFGLGHLYQGGRRAFVMGIYGWMLGWLAQRKKSLRPGMLAHSWQDSLAGILLFLGLGR